MSTISFLHVPEQTGLPRPMSLELSDGTTYDTLLTRGPRLPHQRSHVA